MLEGNCSVQIEVDNQSTTLSADDTIEGRVVIYVSDDVTCNGLVLTMGWETHGRGNHDGASAHQVTLFAGEWNADETYEYEFELKLPPGPFTYRGEYLNVDWKLEATADIPWAFDPSDTYEFNLEPGRASDVFVGTEPPDAHLDDQSDDDSTVSLFALGFGIAFIAMGGLLAALFALEGSTYGMLVGALFAGLGIWGTFYSLKNYFAEKKLGDVDVDVSTHRVSPGETISGEVTLRPREKVSLNEVLVTLHALEKVISGHGTDRSTYTHSVHVAQFIEDDSAETDLTTGRTSFPFSFTIPEDAPYTFIASDNELIWRLEYHIDVPSWPDWEYQEKIVVTPETRSQASPAQDDDSATAEARPSDAASDVSSQSDDEESPAVQW